MKPYKSTSGKTSGEIAYENGEDFIRVQFRGGKVYTYSHSSCSVDALRAMKNLAIDSNGLSTYIALVLSEGIGVLNSKLN